MTHREPLADIYLEILRMLLTPFFPDTVRAYHGTRGNGVDPIGDITAPPNYSLPSRSEDEVNKQGGNNDLASNNLRPYVAGKGVIAPIGLYQPVPAYTEEARDARVQGVVLIQAVVRKDGTVGDLKVLKGLGHGLDESAINTIAAKWRFKPGTLNGIPVDVLANIEVSFALY